jgi:hypothetical protein
MTAHRTLMAVAVAVLLLTAPLVAAPLDPATAAPALDCEKRDFKGECVTEIPIVVPGTPEQSSGDAGPGGRSPVPAGSPTGHPLCSWVNTPATSTLRQMFPDAPPDAAFSRRDLLALPLALLLGRPTRRPLRYRADETLASASHAAFPGAWL